MPTLLPLTAIGELPIVVLPVNTGTVFAVPLPLTCAIAAVAESKRQKQARAIFIRSISPLLSLAGSLHSLDAVMRLRSPISHRVQATNERTDPPLTRRPRV